MPTLQMSVEEPEFDFDNFRPLKDTVLVKFEKPDCEKRSGIVIPEMAHLELQNRNAIVVAVGPKMKDLKKGDRILVRSYGTVKRFGDSHALYPPEEIRGILTNKPN